MISLYFVCKSRINSSRLFDSQSIISAISLSSSHLLLDNSNGERSKTFGFLSFVIGVLYETGFCRSELSGVIRYLNRYLPQKKKTNLKAWNPQIKCRSSHRRPVQGHGVIETIGFFDSSSLRTAIFSSSFFRA